MSGTLTIKLDASILEQAENQARARHTTLPEVVAQHLQIMARNWEDSRAGKTPVTDSLRGSVKLPENFDSQSAIVDQLQKKHGRQG